MRLWSLHPKYLDARGLVALWREGLLARHVLLGKTEGYRHHPQLLRFRSLKDPVSGIDSYLSRVLDEAISRSYSFDSSKIDYRRNCRIRVTEGQLQYEWRHLMLKLKLREPEAYRKWRLAAPSPHPCFVVISGPIHTWERTR